MHPLFLCPFSFLCVHLPLQLAIWFTLPSIHHCVMSDSTLGMNVEL